jgi:isoquinoline 1-oxidoreductase beta subunit
LGTANHLLRLTLERDGSMVLDLPRAAVEQGRTPAIAMVIADAMDMPIESVRVTIADARPALVVDLLTGSSSRYSLVGPIRAMATLARHRLADAAAREWGVSTLDLQLRDGVVFGPGGRLSTFGTLTEAAAS